MDRHQARSRVVGKISGPKPASCLSEWKGHRQTDKEAAILWALAQLPAAERRRIAMHCLESLSCEEITQRLKK